MKHTSEPWSLLSQRQDIIKGKDGSHILECIGHEANPRTQANADRIVACVNACAGMEDPAYEIAKLREEVKRLRGEYGPKQYYSNASSWDIRELDIIFAIREQEGTNFLYKSESGYHGFKDKLSDKDMDMGGFRLIWERESE